MTSVPSRSVTMSDVAARAGVSRTTVSFVLNGRDTISIPQETRARILAVAAELNYRPNAGARALASQKTRLVGLITEIVTAPFAVDIIKGAQDQAKLDDRLLLISSAELDPSMQEAAVETMLEQRVEGLVFAATWHREVRVPDAAASVPVVMVNCFDPDGRFPSIVPDEIGGGRTATNRLISAGHRRIGFVNLDPEIPAAIGRRAGYEQALAEAGIPLDESLIVSGHATADRGYDAAAELLDLANPPTALFCGNDRMAMGAYDAIKERGLRIPQDVAVVGFDNQELIAAYLRPSLTTVALPFESMGARGVHLLAEGSASEIARPVRVTAECPLVERHSV